MRWGVREDAQAEHSTVDIVVKEIENCQAVSAGPNFVVLIFNILFYVIKCVS